VVFDRGLFRRGGPDVALVLWLCGVMIAVTVLAAALGVWQSFLTTHTGQRVMRDLRGRLFTHLQELSLRFFTGTRTGDIQSRLQNDVGGLQSVITDTASSILGNTVTLVSTLVAMAVLSWQLTLLSLALLPVFVWLTGRVGRARRELTGQTQAALSEMSSVTQESLSVSGVLLAKLFGRQDRDAQRYATANEALVGLQVRQQIVGRVFFAVVSTFFGITPVLVYVIAALQLHGGHGPAAGTLIAVTTLQTRLFMLIGQLLQTTTEISSSLAIFTRVFDYLDLSADIVQVPDALTLPAAAIHGRVRLRDVWFSYESEPEAGTERPRRWALKGLDLTVEPGPLAAIVGASGAGKTTVSYLVPRLYDTDRGTVELDGHDVRGLTLPTLADASWSPRRRTFSTRRSGTTWRTPGPTRRSTRWSRRPAPRRSTPGSWNWRTATTRWSANKAIACPAGRSSGSRSPASCSKTRACWSWTRRPAPWTRSTSASFSKHSNR